MKYFIIFLLAIHSSHSKEPIPIPIYAPIEGIRSTFDLAGGRCMTSEGSPTNKQCYEDAVS